MAKPKLSYFDFPGSRGEECRLALTLAGVDFEDHRIKPADWPAMKPSTPFGSMPILEIEGKPPLAQSNAILNHIARRYGLWPDDEWEAARLDSLMDTCEDIRAAAAATFGIKDEEQLKEKRGELTEKIKTWAGNVEKQIRGPFAGGDTMTVADIKLFIVGSWLSKGVLDHVPTDVLDHCPKLKALLEAVKSHPKVVAWYAR